MSNVVLAEDRLLGRRVALKRMNARDDSRALLRLRREALIGASISHPNLVSIYDIVASGGGEYVIVMEYVPGETLRDALARGERLPTAKALTILEGVAAGLDVIHGQGIVHRDVKPGNILLGPNGEVKLADLGIASAPDRTRITTDGAILGTFSYMAPEQLHGKSATAASDVYALAAVAYEALSGRKARRESNPVALAHAIVTQPPPDLREAWPQAPAAAAEVLSGAMAPEPSVRPQSATQLTRQLRAALKPAALKPAVTARPKPAPTERLEPPPAVAFTSPQRESRIDRAAQARTRADLARASRAAAARRAAARGNGPSVRPKQPEVSSSGRRPAQGTIKRALEPAAVPPAAAPSRRRGLFAGILLALLLLAAAVAIAVNQGGPTRRARSAAGVAAGAPRSRTGSRSTTTTHHQHAAKTPAPASTTSALSATAPVTGSAAPSGASSSPSASPVPPTTSASTPMAAAESFYSLAAAHRYSEAWNLADPTFRAQLGGYRSFEYGQARDLSITFDSVRVVSESADAAALGIRTTSVRTTGTQHCAGTVELRRSGSTWLLHQINIGCS